jgi:hypothetical protein
MHQPAQKLWNLTPIKTRDGRVLHFQLQEKRHQLDPRVALIADRIPNQRTGLLFLVAPSLYANVQEVIRLFNEFKVPNPQNKKEVKQARSTLKELAKRMSSLEKLTNIVEQNFQAAETHESNIIKPGG